MGRVNFSLVSGCVPENSQAGGVPCTPFDAVEHLYMFLTGVFMLPYMVFSWFFVA